MSLSSNNSSSKLRIPELVHDLERSSLYDLDDYEQELIVSKSTFDQDVSPTGNPFVEILGSIENLSESPPPPPSINRNQESQKNKVPLSRYVLLHDVCGADVKGVVLDDSAKFVLATKQPVKCNKDPLYTQTQNRMKNSISFLGKLSGFFKKKPSSKSPDADEEAHLFSSFASSKSSNSSAQHSIKNLNDFSSNLAHTSSILRDDLQSQSFSKKKALWGHFIIIKSTLITSSRYHLFYELYSTELTNFKCGVDLKFLIEDAKSEFFSKTSLSSSGKAPVPKTEFSPYDLHDLRLNYEDILSLSGSILIELVSILVGFIVNSHIEDVKDERQRPLLSSKLVTAFSNIESVIIPYAKLLDRANVTARRVLDNCSAFREFCVFELGHDASKAIFEILSRPLITLSKYLNLINGLIKETHPLCPDYALLVDFDIKLRDLLCTANNLYSSNEKSF